MIFQFSKTRNLNVHTVHGITEENFKNSNIFIEREKERERKLERESSIEQTTDDFNDRN